MWTVKDRIWAFAQAISRTELQLHPPTWFLWPMAMSPVRRLDTNLIYLSRSGVCSLRLWGFVGPKHLYSPRSARASSSFHLDVFPTLAYRQISQSSPNTFNGCGTATKRPGLTLITLKGRKGREERESYASHIGYALTGTRSCKSLILCQPPM